MAFVPSFKLYDSTGTALLYTFPVVSYTNAPQSVDSYVKINNHRAKGSLIIEGGEASWTLELRFTILGDDYEAITADIVTLESTIEFNTPYILRIDKTGGSYFEYKVKRIEPFRYAEGLRNWKQDIFANFDVNSW